VYDHTFSYREKKEKRGESIAHTKNGEKEPGAGPGLGSYKGRGLLWERMAIGKKKR